MRAVREHFRDVIAILALMAAGIVTAFVILSSQATALPSWMPILGEERFELKAELQTAQAVTPGQGQAVDISGVQVGDITGVELENGVAVVTMEIDNEYSNLINEDAAMLLRPKTGLNDMVIEVDPGVSDVDIEEGDTLPLASTLPNVQPDEVLASLDADTQAFLKLLLSGGADALDPEKGRDQKLALTLRQFEPLARNVSQLSGQLSKRRANIARSISNFRLLSDELADKDEDLINFVDGSDAVLQRFANQEASIREALQQLPPALRSTQAALESGNAFALEATPALRDSLPGARALAPGLKALRPFLRQTVAPIRDQIRPFTKEVYPSVVSLRRATVGLGNTVPPLRTSFKSLNEGLNALAYNPAGDAEGFLFYVPWLNHNTNSNFSLQDAQGPLRRGVVLETCGTAQLAIGTFEARPFLKTLAELTGLPDKADLDALGAC
jgi:phospholipid/cholesterol/gamma-HCH transport system substrate-binding protein